MYMILDYFSERLLKDGVSGVSDGTSASTTKDLSDGTSDGVSDGTSNGSGVKKLMKEL